MENKKHEFEEIKSGYNREIGALKVGKNEIVDRIGRTENEKNNLQSTTLD